MPKPPHPELPPRDRRPSDWQDLGLQLVTAYNACLTRTKAHRERACGGRQCITPNPKALEQFYALHAFCKDLGVNPLAWIHAVHAVRGWNHRVRVKDLFSKKFLPQFQKWEDTNNADATQLRLKGKSKPFEPLHDFDPFGAEVVKVRYAAMRQPEMCMASIDVTFGYHALSKVCPTCSVREQCKALVEALRGG